MLCKAAGQPPSRRRQTRLRLWLATGSPIRRRGTLSLPYSMSVLGQRLYGRPKRAQKAQGKGDRSAVLTLRCATRQGHKPSTEPARALRASTNKTTQHTHGRQLEGLTSRIRALTRSGAAQARGRRADRLPLSASGGPRLRQRRWLRSGRELRVSGGRRTRARAALLVRRARPRATL